MRAKRCLGEVATTCRRSSLSKMVGSTTKIVIDGESDEHEYLLSAKALIWAPEIDGEIYVNDNEIGGDLEFGLIYEAKITEMAGDVLLATVTKRC